MSKKALMFEHVDGKTYFTIREWSSAIVESTMCGCGKFKQNCECPTYGDEWKSALEDDPARGAR